MSDTPMKGPSSIAPQPPELETCNPGSKRKTKRLLGITLFLLSFVFYGCLALVPFAIISAGSKLALSSALIIFGEASFWLSVLILGKEAASRFRPKKLWSILQNKLRACRNKNGPPAADSEHYEGES
jgi:hypothetical protein